MRKTGTYRRTRVGGEEVAAFVPSPLPPRSPPIFMDPLAAPLRDAEQALARLDLAGAMVPSMDWFIYGFVRKEAVLSSQIEGTQATLVDLLAFEAQPAEAVPDGAVEEICNYLDALKFVRAQLSDPRGLPLSMRLLNEAHGRLMQGVCGADKQPGEIRRSQNWIGGVRPGKAVFVPAPPDELPEALSELERYLHAEDGVHGLIRAGLVHVQFETIHPYLDGNGRMGRLLVTLLLEHWGMLHAPLLYLSLFLKRHRSDYYARLNAVRTEGDWEGWLIFFLEGVRSVADEGVMAARDLFALVERDRAHVLAGSGSSIMAARLFERLPHRPIITSPLVCELLETSKPTAGRAIEALVAAGVLEEITGRKRDRAWAYREYLARLGEGTEL